MRYKKLLLVTFLLVLFVFQQVQQAGAAILPVTKYSPSSDNFQNYAQPAQMWVKVWRLNGNGTRFEPNDPCASGYNVHGCVENPNNDTNLNLYYPYEGNPVKINVENDYLLDVIAHEMPPQYYPNLPALAAQAIAARSFANYKYETSDPNPDYKIIANDGGRYQTFIPYAFDAFLGTDIFPVNMDSCDNNLTSLQQIVCDAVTSTAGEYIAPHNSDQPAKTQFSADWGTSTATGDEPYLQSISDPISTCGVDTGGSHGWGLNQKGANRWALGNQCATASDGNQPWPVKWSDYRQILVHYYTKVDILDGSENKVAPDDRWNLLNYTGLPENVTPGQPFALELTVQNTSTTAWNNDVILGWKWVSTTECDSAWTTDNTQYLSADPGKNVTPNPTITITPPSNPGTYILHIDVKRTNGIWFQDQTPKWPDAQIQVQVGSEASIDPNAGAGFYPQGLTGCYYNDTEPTSIPPAPPDPPINWNTFTNFVTKVPNEAPLTFWRTTPLTSPLTGINNTFWSARWIGKLNVVQAGNYTFHLAFLDDGGRIFVDKITDNDTPLIESWYTQGQHNYTSDPVYLTAGLHNVRIDYAQGPMLHSSMYVGWSCLECPYIIAGSFIDRSLPLPPAVTIHGNVGEGAGGATLYYTDGIAKSVTADASGNYSLVVPYGWSGTVTPSLAGYTFNPASISYPATYADQASSTPDFVPTSVPTLTVTNTGDSGSGSLRDAIAYANPGATILFAPNLSGQTINLNNTLFISKNITLDGSMLASPVILSGAGVTPHVTVLRVNTGVTVTLKNLTIANGKPGINNSGVLTIRNSNIVNNSSSGIVNNGGGDLTITDTIISNNAGDANGGGGIRNDGKSTIISSTFSNNTATVATYSSGGGIFNLGKLIVISSTFSSNTASASGGGINNKSTGELEVISSTFYGNVATGTHTVNTTRNGSGGGIYNSISYPKYVTVTNSTFANNSADNGGGIYTGDGTDGGYLVVTNSTFSDNIAALQGGGIYNNSLLYYANSILANSTGGDCANEVYNGSIKVNINNLVEDGSCSAGITGDPALGIFGSNGGPTQTMALLPGSPAINAGDNILCEQSPVNNRDQRGVLRTHDAQCDLGAYEYYVDPAIPTVGTFTAPATTTSLTIPIASFTASDDVGVTGYMITESATAPSYTGNGWASTAPTTYMVSTAGNHILYPWVKDANGNTSVVSTSPVSVTVTLDTTPPTVTSITRASANPTNAASVNYTVTFSEPVINVGTNDFSLTASGMSGASVTGVSGSGNSYTVTVSTGSGSGTLQLVIPAGATITDLAGNAPSNLPFAGEVYTIDKTAPTVISINRESPPSYATLASSVTFKVTFSEPVIGVDMTGPIYNDFNLTTGLTGASVTGVSGTGNTYIVTVNTGTGGSTLRLNLLDKDTILDSAGNKLGGTGISNGDFSNGQIYNVRKATFTDVPTTHWAWEFVERVAYASVTVGCTASTYCPDTYVTRAQIAVFLLRGEHGSSYVPPTASGTMFGDVPASYWAAAWIEQLATEGITGGCSGGNYCPETTVARDQVAIFLLRAKHGFTYTPPAIDPNLGTGFSDVPVNYWAAAWIKQLVAEGIAGGCGNGNYCPTTPVTRAQMAVFLVKTFNLP